MLLYWSDNNVLVFRLSRFFGNGTGCGVITLLWAAEPKSQGSLSPTLQAVVKTEQIVLIKQVDPECACGIHEWIDLPDGSGVCHRETETSSQEHRFGFNSQRQAQ